MQNSRRGIRSASLVPSANGPAFPGVQIRSPLFSNQKEKKYRVLRAGLARPFQAKRSKGKITARRRFQPLIKDRTRKRPLTAEKNRMEQWRFSNSVLQVWVGSSGAFQARGVERAGRIPSSSPVSPCLRPPEGSPRRTPGMPSVQWLSMATGLASLA